MQSKSSLKMRYCPMIDCFINVRELAQEEMDVFFQDADMRDKRSYQELVVKASIPEYDEKVRSLIHSEYDREVDVESAIEELYRMCIKVNPSLNIYNVNIPVQEKERPSLLLSTEKKDLWTRIREIDGIDAALKKRVVGQDEAIDQIAQCIKSAKVGIRDSNRPVGCFLFIGQTGVGKTELAKALAEFLTGDEKNMVRVDCSEFSQPHEYAKLIGAPPGYVGYDDGGSFTEQMLKRPGNVVLFDEIEKANPMVHNLLLQVMDEGTLTDNKGRRIPFHDAVIILTSNAGVKGIEKMKSAVGFTRQDVMNHEMVRRETLKSLEKIFRPEFLNRIDEIICFNPLGPKETRRIVQLQLAKLQLKLNEMKIHLRFSKAVINFVISEGADPRYGARPLKRNIKKFIEIPLTERILREQASLHKRMLAVMSEEKSVVFVDQPSRRRSSDLGKAIRNKITH
ncbi:MAG: AAA family ATPase [bacterium]